MIKRNSQFCGILLLICLQVKIAVLVTNVLQNGGYTSIPNELIDKNATFLYLDFNNLTTINSSTDFFGCQVEVLYMQYNLLDEFPFMPNIGTTLNGLYMNNNKIKSLMPARVQILQRIQMISLTSNLLTAFPDFYHQTLKIVGLSDNQLGSIPKLPILGKNLTAIYIASNSIQSLDLIALASYAKLTYMNLALNNLTTFPNYCVGTGTTSYSIVAYGNNWNCDCRLRWILTAKKVSKRSGSNPLITCSSPPHLAGKDLLILKETQLTCDGK